MLQRFIWLLILVAFSWSCKKQDETLPTDPNPPAGTPGLNEPGYGKSRAPFKDPAWQLPNGVGASVHWFGYCDTDSNWVNKKNYVGVPNPMLQFFIVCIEFRNSNNNTLTIRLPPSITLTSKYLETQNGFIIIPPAFDFTMLPNETRRLFFPVYCVNEDRRAPFDRVDLTNEWTLGPEKLPAPVQEIVDIITPKNITYEKILKADGRTEDEVKAKKLWIIQSAIWEVTDGQGLQAETRQKLRDLSL